MISFFLIHQNFIIFQQEKEGVVTYGLLITIICLRKKYSLVIDLN